MSDSDIQWMHEAIALARQAEALGEVPVGALVVYKNEIVGMGFNSPISSCNPVAHAEIIALQQAAQTLENYRLPECELYVTLEPCTMCAGAMVHSRIKRLIYGALEPKAGAIISQAQVLEMPQMNHRIEVTGGVLGDACGALLSDFFKKRRKQRRAERQARLKDQS